MSKMKFNTDRIIGLSAMLISLLTLIIFIYQTNIMRVQSRLSVTPRLSFNTNEDVKDSLYQVSTEIVNKGLGPAIIESIQIIHKGTVYDLNFGEFFNQAYPDLKKFGSLTQNMTMSKGSTLSPNERNRLFTYTILPSKIKELMQYLGIKEGEIPFTIGVIYSSIYNERWKTGNKRDDHPLKL